jgi:hypothetical protein
MTEENIVMKRSREQKEADAEQCVNVWRSRKLRALRMEDKEEAERCLRAEQRFSEQLRLLKSEVVEVS